MRRAILTILCLLCICLTAQSGDTIRVLCIGNSFSADAVEQSLYEMAHSRGVELIIGNVYYQGCSLKQHVQFMEQGESVYAYRKITNGKRQVVREQQLPRMLSDERWDYVSLQQVSTSSGYPDSFEPWLSRLIDSVSIYCPKAKLIWHMTWAYQEGCRHKAFDTRYGNSQAQMYEAICNCLSIVRKHPFSMIVPTGAAIQYGRESCLGDTFCREDGCHLQSSYGRYTAACTWLEALTGINPIGIGYKPKSLSVEQALICQKAAHKAVMDIKL